MLIGWAGGTLSAACYCIGERSSGVITGGTDKGVGGWERSFGVVDESYPVAILVKGLINCPKISH